MSNEPGRILALDVGLKRIGVAVSDPGRLTAQPLKVLRRRNRDADLAALARLADEQQASLLVVGYPRRSGGEPGQHAEAIVRLGRRLARRLGLELVLIDEYATSQEADEVMLAADLSRRRRRQVRDKLAAALILRRYLDGMGGEDP